ncbi:hypothetical protein K1T71_006118 [Dendrolimus kikuchii]|uniref:Uncharacterized protein n=1 Tax=Dendrolimus kikuchii TaxID=765133 RepID=A0ACC1D3F3_9NEOP|nr:hypothetical protein K1T71_006118 [Dendrolimus kikuchii]
MAKEDVMLGLELGRLQIEPYKLNKFKNNDNPFSHTIQQRRNLRKQKISKVSKCSCMCDKSKKLHICKNKPNKIIKEPILQLLKKGCSQNISLDKEESDELLNKNAFQVAQDNVHMDSLNLFTLVQNCNQLKISSEIKDQSEQAEQSTDELKWWKSEVSSARDIKESAQSSRSGTGTCSQQALNPPCDITIDELASYFETLVHIPKKMSSMAEMMYI